MNAQAAVALLLLSASWFEPDRGPAPTHAQLKFYAASSAWREPYSFWTAQNQDAANGTRCGAHTFEV